MVKLSDVRMKPKLVTLFLVVGVLPLAICAWLSYRTANQSLQDAEEQAANSLEKQAFAQLVAIRDAKKNQVDGYFQQSRTDLQVLEENVKGQMAEAFRRLEAVQQLKKREIEDFFKKTHQDVTTLTETDDVQNLFEELKKHHDEMHVGLKEDFPASGERYEEIVSEHGRYLRDFVKNYGYYDAFIVCAPHGHVMCSTAGEKDLGANLGHGPYKEEGLAQLWHAVVEQKGVVVEDFSPYSPIGGKHAAFIGAPLYNNEKTLLGMVALQIPANAINRIVQARDGMGSTGESYLVGKDHGKTAFRSDMLTMDDGKYVIGREIHTTYIDKAIDGESDSALFTDSLGNPVMVTYEPLQVKGLQWALVSKMNLEEAVAFKLDGDTDDVFQKYVKGYGYYDLFLINDQGYCFYSVGHEPDYRTNLVSGKFKDSNLGELTRQVLSTGKFGFTDFATYAPSNGAPASFMAQPVVDEKGAVEIVVALQMPLDKIDGIMSVRTGMGDTGETYLVGADKRIRSNSFLDKQGHSVAASFAGTVKDNGVDTEAASLALEGKTDAKIVDHYNGNPVLSAFTPIDIFGTRWVLLAEIDNAEAFAPAKKIEEDAAVARSTLISSTLILVRLP